MSNTSSQAGLDLDNPNQPHQDGPVECLGKTFANDQERRDYYLAILAEKLKDPEFRKIEGFPIGEDEDILNLSDPPYYTACPNPFIEDFIAHYGRPYNPDEKYKREPYAADVSIGKNHPIYSAHSYHTKVPHEAISFYIEHYTKPGNIVLDGFSGTGMTGLAAALSNGSSGVGKKGRFCLLNDLSPLAGHISFNLNNPVEGESIQRLYEKHLESKLSELESKLYSINESELTNYVIWTDCYVCKECGHEYNYWDAAVDLDNGEAKKKFPCPNCSAEQTTRSLERAYDNHYDQLLDTPIRLFKQIPVRVSYFDKNHKKRQRKILSSEKEMLRSFELSQSAKESFPIQKLKKGDRWKRDAFADKGITHIHHFYTYRAIEALSGIYNAIESLELSFREKSVFRFIFTSFTDRNATKRNRFVINKHNPRGRVNGPMANSLYAPNLFCEMNLIVLFKEKMKDIISGFSSISIKERTSFIQNSSSTKLYGVPDRSIDYIFTDPPFGHNIQYSELNLPLESFLKVKSAESEDIVVNESVGKDFFAYTDSISEVFCEYYRVLKPSRWMTVEFHNSKSSVWNSIQEAIKRAGFVVASVATLDKKQKTIHQDFNVGGTVDKDLIISAYKPSQEIELQIKKKDFDVWLFVREYVANLPPVKKTGDMLTVVQSRLPRAIYDTLISFCIQNDILVGISFKELTEGLRERFAERDGMIFLPDQVVQYDKARMTSSQLRQLTIFVDDEASAIEWLRQQLNDKPQTYQDIHPKFINELSGWKKAEMQLELSTLLKENFLKYEGKGPVPSQIHSYLSTNFKDMRSLDKEDSQLVSKAKDRWFVPDPNNEEQVQQLRERALLKQFEEYKNHTGKKIKLVRMEAVRAGFKKAFQEKEYQTIIYIAEKIPEHLLQEDQKLLMWYDQAQTRLSEESLF